MYCIDVCTHVEFISEYLNLMIPHLIEKRLTLGERKWGTSRRRRTETREERGIFRGMSWALHVWRHGIGFLRFTSARSIWDLTWLHQGGCHGCHGCSLYLRFELKSKKTLKRMRILKTSHVSAMRPMGITAVPLTFSRFNLKKPFLPWSVGDSRTVVI